MDSKFVKVTMIVALADYGMKSAVGVRDHFEDDYECKILDWQEEDMKIVPVKTTKK